MSGAQSLVGKEVQFPHVVFYDLKCHLCIFLLLPLLGVFSRACRLTTDSLSERVLPSVHVSDRGWR